MYGVHIFSACRQFDMHSDIFVDEDRPRFGGDIIAVNFDGWCGEDVHGPKAVHQLLQLTVELLEGDNC